MKEKQVSEFIEKIGKFCDTLQEELENSPGLSFIVIAHDERDENVEHNTVYATNGTYSRLVHLLTVYKEERPDLFAGVELMSLIIN